MTGPQLRAIREHFDLTRLQWGRALGYTGEDEGVQASIRRTETMDRVPSQVARLAEMYQRHGVPKEFVG